MSGERQGGPRFEIVRTLGSGGFGVVHEVIDRERGEHMAMKTLARVEADALRRFKQEFRAIADVSHENLVRLHELLFLDGQWSFTMELLDGVQLLEWVWKDGDVVSATAATLAAAPAHEVKAGRTANGPPNVDLHRLRDAARQTARGIAALHAERLVHRDLKPSNVLVQKDGRVVIVDFGIAREFGEGLTSATNALVGTPAYMAPEQGTDAEIGPPADWYAFGIMLFEALTGRLPFLGTAIQVLTDKQRFEAVRVREIAPDAPEDLDALVADLLRKDPLRRPGTADILRRLGDSVGVKRTTPTTPGKTTIVGRDKELAALEAALARAREGDGAIAILRGRSGMGKTALVRRFVEVAGSRAPIIFLEGRCYERESLPYKGFDGIIDALAREVLRMPKVQAAMLTPRDAAALARVFPVLSRIESIDSAPRRGLDAAAPHEIRARAFTALRELLSRLADRSPVVVFIDDLQWADTDTVALLGEITSPPDAPSILTIIGHRTEGAESSAMLAALVDRSARPHIAAVEPIDVGPLDNDAAVALARELLRTDQVEITGQIAAEAGGSPFFIGEICRWVQSEPRRVDAIRIDRVVEERVRELDEDARAVLALVAVAGRPVTRMVLMSAAELDAEVATRAIGTLRLHHLVRLAGPNGVECFHDRIREAVSGMLDEAQLRDRHARLARALIATGVADPDRLFDHFRGAGDVTRASEAAEAAAATAQGVFAFDRVAELLRYVIDALPSDSPRRDALLRGLADALSSCGRCADAADTYLAARPENENQAIELRVRAAQNLLYGGHTDRGTEVVESVLQLFRYRLPRSKLGAIVVLVLLRIVIRLRGLDNKPREAKTIDARTLAKIDVCFNVAEGLALADTLKAQVFGQKGVLLALRTGEPMRVCRAYIQDSALLTVTAKTQADVDRGLAVIARAQHLIDSHSLAEMRPLVQGARAWAHHFAGNWPRAIADFDAALELQRLSGNRNRFYFNTGIYLSNVALLFSGQLAELQRRFPANLREAVEIGDRYLQTNLRCGSANAYYLLRGEPDVARENVREALASWSRRGYQIQHFNGLLGEAQADLYDGRPEAALQRLVDRIREIRRAGITTVTYSSACLWSTYARAAVAVAAAKRDKNSMTTAMRAIRRLGALWLPWAKASAQMLDGIVANVRGDDASAVRSLRDAARAFDGLDMRLYAETTRLRIGQLVGGDEGRDLVTGANEWLVREAVREPARLAMVFTPELRT
ncbi:MAG TPA: protein kinase [Kofleriaceae bacterium]